MGTGQNFLLFFSSLTAGLLTYINLKAPVDSNVYICYLGYYLVLLTTQLSS